MPQTIKLKRSNQIGNAPTEGQLELGEVAINTKDGKMFIKKSDEASPTPNEEIVEVGKIADNLQVTESINVASGKLFVSNSGSANSKYYTKMGDYGEGNFFAKGGSNNGAVYTLGVGSEGKIVEDQKIKTFEIKGEGFLNINANPLTLIPAESGKAHIIHDIVFFIEHTGQGAYNASATPTGGNGIYFNQTAGNGWITNNFLYEIGFYNTTSSFKQLVYLPRTHLAQSAADSIFINQGIKDHKLYANRALMLRSPANNVITNSAYVPVDGNRHFIKVRYSTVSVDADFRNLTEGDSGRTVFDGS